MCQFRFTFFIISQSFLVTFRFSKAFSAIERLTSILDTKNRALTDLTQNLEEKVAERTHEIKKAYKEIERLALTDPLTNLANRRSILNIMTLEKDRMERNQKSFTIAIFDIDDFKSINDSYGHDCGDAVLVALSDIVREMLRKQDKVARWGGEEFLLFFPDTPIRGAQIITEKLRAHIENSNIQFNDLNISITATFGLCENYKSMEINHCIQKADQALYEGKRQGKNCIIIAE